MGSKGVKNNFPVLAVLSWRSFPGSSVLVVLSFQTCPASPVLAVQQSCPCCPGSRVPAVLSFCAALIVLSWNSCPGFPFLAVLSCILS
jgi:hypothetical protein